jgi:phosphate transport system protein
MDTNFPNRSFENKINNLIEEAKDLGHNVLESHKKSIGLIDKYDSEIALEIKEASKKIDDANFHLERQCIRFIATEHPFAGDLLFVESLIRVGSHLKRIGYLAANTTNMAEKIKDVEIKTHLKENLEYMGDYVSLMLGKAFNSFINQDLSSAKQLRLDDDKVDNLFDSILAQVTDEMFENKDNIAHYINLIFIARFLERTADRAVNIAARTIFILNFNKTKV